MTTSRLIAEDFLASAATLGSRNVLVQAKERMVGIPWMAGEYSDTAA